jgi:hypothetical protein
MLLLGPARHNQDQLRAIKARLESRGSHLQADAKLYWRSKHLPNPVLGAVINGSSPYVHF